MKSMSERLSISSDELRQQRVDNAVSMAESASYSAIMSYRTALFEKVNKIEAMFDLGSTSTTDIASNLINFNAAKWAEELYKEDNLVNIMLRVNYLNCRIKVHNSLFPNNKIDPITAKNYPGGVLELILGSSDKQPENVVTTSKQPKKK